MHGDCNWKHTTMNVVKDSNLIGMHGDCNPNDTYYPISKWEVSNVEDGGFLLNLDVIVDHNKRAPSPDRLKAWKEGHAHLCHGYYSIEVKAQRIEDIPADELQKLIEKA